MNQMTLAIITAALGLGALAAAGFSTRQIILHPGKTYRVTLIADDTVDLEDVRKRFEDVGAQFSNQQGRQLTFIMSPGTNLEVNVPAPLPGFPGVTIQNAVEV